MPRRSALPCSVAYGATASSSLSGLPILRSGPTTRSASAAGPQEQTGGGRPRPPRGGGPLAVPAAAAQGPEQIRVLGGADAQPLAVRRHQLRAHEVVAREPEPAADA